MTTRTLLAIKPNEIPFSSRLGIAFRVLIGIPIVIEAEEVYEEPRLVIP